MDITSGREIPSSGKDCFLTCMNFELPRNHINGRLLLVSSSYWNMELIYHDNDVQNTRCIHTWATKIDDLYNWTDPQYWSDIYSDIYIITVLIATYLNRKHENIVPYMVSKPSRAIDYDSGWLTRCEVFALLGMF